MAYEDDSPYPVNNTPNPSLPQDQEQPNTSVPTLPYIIGGPNATPPPTEPTSGMTQGQGGQGFGDFLSGLFGNGVGFNLGTGIPAIMHAIAQWKNADKYAETAREAAGMASPVDQATRLQYQQRLNELYTDPAKFLQGNPEFMANKKLGEQELFARMNSKGLGGSGGVYADQMRFLTDLSSRYVNQERDFLSKAGGFQFDPANAANMLMKGNEQEIAAKNSALAALAYMFGGNQGGNPAGGGGGGGVMDMIRQFLNGGRSSGGGGGGGSVNPTSLLQFISQLPGSSLPPELFQTLGMDQNPFDTDLLTQLGLSNSGIDPGTLNFGQDFGGGGSLTDILNQAGGGGLSLQDSIGDQDPLSLIFGGDYGGGGGIDLNNLFPGD